MKSNFLKIFCISVIIIPFFSSFSNATTTKVDNTKNDITDINNVIINADCTTFALKNCSIIDGTGEKTKTNSIVVIDSGKIKAIGEQNKITIPNNAKIIDLKGATVLPGFINSHLHDAYDETKLQNWLKHGVTTVRDLSAHIDDYLQKRDELNKNNKNAFVLSANKILGPVNGYGDLTYTSAEDAKNKVLKLCDDGVDAIKLCIEDDCEARKWKMSTLDEVKNIVDAAHLKNKRASAHISHARNLQIAIDAGVDEVAHMVVDPIDSKTIKEMVDKNMYFIPTLELWKNVSKKYPVNYLDCAKDNLMLFYKAGGKVALGTDYGGYKGCSFDEDFPITEVKLMQNAGMSNMDIIVAGTKNAAYVCGLSDKLGTIEVGKNADLLIVDGNPLLDINALTKTKIVIHNGKIIK